MNKYTPNLKVKNIIMLNDQTPWDYPEEEEEEKVFLQGLKDYFLSLGIEFINIDVAVEEDLNKLLVYSKNETVVFNWCEVIADKEFSSHWPAKFLEKHGYVYTGASAKFIQSNELKNTVKDTLILNGVPTPKYAEIIASDPYEVSKAKIDGVLTYPVIVKLLDSHGSLGIDQDSVCEDFDCVYKKIQKNKEKYRSDSLIEEFIVGDEYILSLWGNDPDIEVLPIMKINFSDDWKQKYKLLTYESKFNITSDEFLESASEQAKVAARLKSKLSDIAIQAYKACGCRDYGRMEIIVSGSTASVIDVNVNPSFVTTSSFLRSANIAGYSQGEVVARICEFALNRSR